MKLWEMYPYFREGIRNDYIIKILEPNTPWKIAVGKLAQKNKHGGYKKYDKSFFSLK